MTVTGRASQTKVLLDLPALVRFPPPVSSFPPLARAWAGGADPPQTSAGEMRVLASIALTVLLNVGHETANQIGDFIGGGIEGEVARIKDVHLSLRDVTAVRIGLRRFK